MLFVLELGLNGKVEPSSLATPTNLILLFWMLQHIVIMALKVGRAPSAQNTKSFYQSSFEWRLSGIGCARSENH